MRAKVFSFVVGLMLAMRCAAGADAGNIVVSAGEFDRKDTLVSFALTNPMDASKIYGLRDEGGAITHLQIDRGGSRGWFLLSELKAGAIKSYSIVTLKFDEPPETVKAIKTGGVVDVSIGGKKVLAYQGAKTKPPEGVGAEFERGGYIWPVLTPSGKSVVDDYPADHRHHHGIWSPWTKTEFEGRHPDFWNMGQKTGRVEVVGEPSAVSGPVFAQIQAKHQFVDMTATPEKVALNETWELTVFSAGASDAKYRIFDLLITQTCASQSPLKLPKYHYGGLGVRGHIQWLGKGDVCKFLTSEGHERATANETTGKWGHIGGMIDGEFAGVAILCHPDNFRAPQGIRANPQEPFFCYCASQGGDWSIEPGTPYVARYRFVVADGAPNKAELDRMWNDYAKMPVVTVK